MLGDIVPIVLILRADTIRNVHLPLATHPESYVARLGHRHD